MHSGWQHDNLLATAVAYLEQRDVLTTEGAAKDLDLCLTANISEQVGQFFEAIGKAIGELNTSNFGILEEMWKPELVSSTLVILILSIGIGYPSASSSPLGQFLGISVAHFHTLIEQTARFGEALDNKMGLTPDALNAEVKPTWCSVGVGLLLEIDLIGVVADQVYSV